MTRNQRGRQAFRKRQKKNAERTERYIQKQQQRMLGVSILILAVSLFIGVTNTMSAKTKSITDESAWRLPKLSGKGNISLSDFSGKPTVVSFYSSTCAECADGFKALVEASNALAGKVNFVAINTRENNKAAALKAAKDLGISKWPIAHDVGEKNSKFHDVFKGTDTYTTIYYDRGGNKLQATIFVETPETLRENMQTYYELTY